MARLYKPSASGWVPAHAVTVPPDPVPPDPEPTPTGVLFGVNVNPNQPRGDLASRLNDYGRVPATRLYYTGGLPSTVGPIEQRAPEKRAQVSFKYTPSEVVAGTWDTAIRTYAMDAFNNGYEIYLTFWHEPNGELNAGQFTPTDYRNAHYRVSKLLNGLPGGAADKIRPMVNFSARKTKLGAPLDPTWVPPYSLMGNTRATLSWDSYGFPPKSGGVPDLTTQYPPLDQILSLAMSDTATAGYNFDGGWGITEFNTPIRTWDTQPATDAAHDQDARLQWYRDYVNYCLQQGPLKAGGGRAQPHHIFVWAGDDANWNGAAALYITEPKLLAYWRGLMAQSI